MKLGEYLSSGGTKAAIEGSTHYGRNGDRLAAGLAEVGGQVGKALPAAAVSLLSGGSGCPGVLATWVEQIRMSSQFGAAGVKA